MFEFISQLNEDLRPIEEKLLIVFLRRMDLEMEDKYLTLAKQNDEKYENFIVSVITLKTFFFLPNSNNSFQFM